MIFFRAGVGASLSDEDDGHCELLKCRLHHSVDEYSSRLRVDDLRYLEERPGLYEEFDYVIYNEDFFYCQQRFESAESLTSSIITDDEEAARCPNTSMVSTRSCSDLAERSDSCSSIAGTFDHNERGGGDISGAAAGCPGEYLLLSPPSAPLIPPPPHRHHGNPSAFFTSGESAAAATTPNTTTRLQGAAGIGDSHHRECGGRARCASSMTAADAAAAAAVLPHYASPQAIELEFLLRQKFGDRHGYYPLIGLHSYIPRRLLRGGILDVLFELAMNMVSFMAGKGGECLIDLTNSIFVVKNLNELSYIDDALAKYSRWIAETQTHTTRPQIPFANDIVQYTIHGGVAEETPAFLCLDASRDLISSSCGGEDDDEEELILSWMDHLVYLAPLGRRDKALYLSALKYILIAP